METHRERVNGGQTVAGVVLEHSECAAVFQRHRIDFCCRGEMTIEAAAQAKKVDVVALIDELTRAIDERRSERSADVRALSVERLIAHIVSHHHGYLREALPFVCALASKVARVHGDHNPKLPELDVAVQSLSSTLLPHLDAEERELFPLMTAEPLDETVIAEHLKTMMDDHYAVATLLERIRAASDDFTLPAWACNSYRTLFSELEQLESDVFAHVHLENHVLRARFADC